MDMKERKFARMLCGIIALAGLLQAWAARFYIEPDGVNYLDVAYAYLRRDWRNAINDYWSPLYSWLLAMAIRVTHVGPYWESTLLHGVNFLIFLFALGCFAFFFRELTRWWAASGDLEEIEVPQGWSWVLLGYAIFAYCELELIHVGTDTPDMLVSALFFLATGILIRMRREEAGWMLDAALGVVLAAGYLAKAVMFPLAFVFLFCSLFTTKNIGRGARRAAIALVVFFVFSGPWLIVLSHAKGRVTYGETGRLNYAWYVNGREGAGEKPSEIVVETFGAGNGGTYPLWYEPSTFNKNVHARIDVREQLRVLARSGAEYFGLLSAEKGIAAGLLVLIFFAGSGRNFGRRIGELWSAWLPAAATFGIYALVHVETRFLGAAVAIFWCALFASVALPRGESSGKLWKAVALAVTIILAVTIAKGTARDVAAVGATENVEWDVAKELQGRGLVAGEKVAVLGHENRADYWEHLAGVQVAADIPAEDVPSYWNASAEKRAAVLDAFARAGAKFVVTDLRPPAGDMAEWFAVGTTGYYVRALSGAVAPD